MMHLTMDLRCGVSGDMLLGALLDWYERENGNIQSILDMIMEASSVQSPTRVWVKDVEREGIRAKRLHTEWDPLCGSAASGKEMLSYMGSGLERTGLNSRVRKLAGRILMNILEAEAVVHNERSPHEVHLHEAGTPDTLADVIGIAYVSDIMEVDGYWVRATPLSLGRGMIATEHGAYDVPVPAVRHMIREIPARGGPVEGELATPTGTAAVKALVELWMDHGEVDDGSQLPGRPVGRGAGERMYDGGPVRCHCGR